MNTLEDYFGPFRDRVVDRRSPILTPYGEQRKLYVDQTASGQVDSGVEERVLELKSDYANTHTTSSFTGERTTARYNEARRVIREHVNAGDDDVLMTAGSGMTAAMNKLVRMMGLVVPEQYRGQVDIADNERPVVILTDMEHHSNILPWQESIADVVVLEPGPDGLPSLDQLKALCQQYHPRPLIGSFTAASNVTGVRTPYHAMSRIMHEHGGVCVVDFAASAPYDRIDMHPDDDEARLDAITFSPHKFQGGVETPGILVAHKGLLRNTTPDRTGGGTVRAVDRWGGRWYHEHAEEREDGGTPPIIGTMRAALALRLKDAMGVENIHQREQQLVHTFMDGLQKIKGVTALEAQNRNRVGIVSFTMDGIHHGLVNTLLNDRFGIQARNGCSCAGPYGHRLLGLTRDQSHRTIGKILDGDESARPGWVRVSLHPTMLNTEVDEVLDAVEQIRRNIGEWNGDYTQNERTGAFDHVTTSTKVHDVRRDFQITM